MDDDRTQQTLDDLAELFLTGTTPVVPRRADADVDRRADPVRLRAKPAAPAITSASSPPTPPRSQPIKSATPALRLTETTDPAHDHAAVDVPEAESVAAPAAVATLDTPAPAALDASRPGTGASVAPATNGKPGRSRATTATTGDDDDHTDAHRPVRPAFEAVLLGNLPGLAQAWLTQYAQLVAQRDGPVLLLTLNDDPPLGGEPFGDESETSGGGGVIEAELIEPTVRDVLRDAEDDERFPAPPLRLPPVSQRRVSWLLKDLLNDSHAPVATVLVYTDNDPSQIDRLLDVGVWTLLTGADETAIAAGAKSLHALAEAHPEAPGASVGVFVLGSPEERATHAADALIDACLEHFDAPLDPLGHLQKMRPAAVRTLGDFPGLDDQWDDLLEALVRYPVALSADDEDAFTEHEPLAPEPEPEPVAATRATEPPRTTDKPAEGDAPRPSIREWLAQVHPEPETSRDQSPAPASKPHRPTPVPTTESREPQHANGSHKVAPVVSETSAVETPAEPSAQTDRPLRPAALATSPGGGGVATAPDLSTLLTAARPHLDLHRLTARCPDHPALDLVIDRAGRLHLLARLTDGDHARAALLELRDTRRWAVRHRDLIALAAPADRPLATDEPATHLFTDRPEQAVPLVAAVDPDVRLHLLQHLELRSGPAWLATPLQAE